MLMGLDVCFKAYVATKIENKELGVVADSVELKASPEMKQVG